MFRWVSNGQMSSRAKYSVVLSEAKDLLFRPWQQQILRFAQDDDVIVG